MPTETAIPIANADAEQAVLGAILLDNAAYWKIAGHLEPLHFYIPRHCRIYGAMRNLLNRQEPVDIVTVTDELTRNGNAVDARGLIDLSMPTSAGIVHHARLIQERAWLRQIRETGHNLLTIANDQTANAELAIEQATKRLLACFRSRAEVTPFLDAIVEALREVEWAAEHRTELLGVATGFLELNKICGGLCRGENVVISGRTGMGKSSLALHLLLAAAAQNKPVALITLEMGRTQLAMRAIAAQSGISMYRLKHGLIEHDQGRMIQSANALGNLPLFLVELGNVAMAEILEVGRKLKLQHHIEVLCVDNLNLVRGGHKYEGMSDNSRLCKLGAKELDVVFLALHQVNRDVDDREDKRPRLSDLKQSGSVENDADKVLFFYRDGYYHNDQHEQPAELDLAKHRDGPTGVVHVTWVPKTMSFIDEPFARRARVI